MGPVGVRGARPAIQPHHPPRSTPPRCGTTRDPPPSRPPDGDAPAHRRRHPADRPFGPRTTCPGTGKSHCTPALSGTGPPMVPNRGTTPRPRAAARHAPERRARRPRPGRHIAPMSPPLGASGRSGATRVHGPPHHDPALQGPPTCDLPGRGRAAPAGSPGRTGKPRDGRPPRGRGHGAVRQRPPAPARDGSW